MPPHALAPSLHPQARRVWCLFDFANSAFPTVVLSAFGGPYFARVLIGREGLRLGGWRLEGTAAWGLALALSMLLVTLSASWTGKLADRGPYRRLLLALYVVLCVGATAGLAFLQPGAAMSAFVLLVLANFAFEGAYVVYNAFLVDLAPAEEWGRLSGRGWAFGYVGGLLALVLAFPLAPKDYDASTGRWLFLIVALWYLVFALPAFFVLPERNAASAAPAESLWTSLRRALARREILLFLAAYFLYNDAVVTVIQFTGVFTKEVLAFTPRDNILLFIVLNVVAIPGSLAFGRWLDRFGGARTIVWTLALWVVVCIAAALTPNKAWFWGVALLAAWVIGATQASSRALMAQLAPEGRSGEYMGLLAISGKASSVLGPALYGILAQALADPLHPDRGHRVSIASISLFFVVSMFLMRALSKGEGRAA